MNSIQLQALENIRGVDSDTSSMVNRWLAAIEAMRGGDVYPMMALPSWEWQTLRDEIPEVQELFSRHFPTQ